MIELKITIIKKLILAITALIGLLQAQPLVFGGITDYTEVPKYTETVTGYNSVSIFENEVTKLRIQVPITKTTFDDIFYNRVRPQMDGHRWIGASENPIIQRNLTILQDNQFYKDGADVASSSLIKIKLPNESEKVILESSLNML